MTNILFCYAKEGMVRCLTFEEAKNEKLDEKGWAHTATLNPARWIESIVNGKIDPSYVLDELQFSKK